MAQIPASALCKILKIDDDEYREWERARLIRRVGSRGCTRGDAIQAAIVLRLLGKNLDRDDVRRVMDGVREDLAKTLPVGRLRIICHLQHRTGGLVVGSDASADAAVGRAASTDRLIMVIDATEEVAFAIQAFENELRGRASRGPAKSNRRVSQLRGD